MALRGRRPAVEDLAAVTADPTTIGEITDRYLESPEFGATMRELHNEELLVRTGWFNFPAGFQAKAPLQDEAVADINRALMEAPLALIEYVIMNDRPYTEIVTAPYAMVDHIGAKVWGDMPYVEGGPDWQVTAHYDGRGNAGILSDPWLFTRHTTTVSNANRGRANAISKALLCYDFLSRDIRLDAKVNLADPQAVAHAVKENAACASCHHTLDPLAGFFQSYFPIYVPYSVTYPMAFYMPQLLSRAGGTVEPAAYFGQPGKTIEDLGRFIARDPRFSLCATERFYAFFHQIELPDVPEARAHDLQQIFEASGFRAKDLAREIVLADDFRVSHALDEKVEAKTIGYKRATPEQLARLFDDLTGYRWMGDTGIGQGTVEMATDSFFGFRVLAGGIDAFSVTRPSRTFNATSNLFFAELAEHAADHVVEHDFATVDQSARTLLKNIGEVEVDETLVRAQLADLHLRLFGEAVAPDSSEVGETYALFDALYQSSSRDARRAWKGTIAAMLEDLRIVTY
jgi:hypothetical protein